MTRPRNSWLAGWCGGGSGLGPETEKPGWGWCAKEPSLSSESGYVCIYAYRYECREVILYIDPWYTIYIAAILYIHHQDIRKSSVRYCIICLQENSKTLPCTWVGDPSGSFFHVLSHYFGLCCYTCHATFFHCDSPFHCFKLRVKQRSLWLSQPLFWGTNPPACSWKNRTTCTKY